MRFSRRFSSRSNNPMMAAPPLTVPQSEPQPPTPPAPYFIMWMGKDR